VIDQSLAQQRTVPNTRELRALALAEERFEEIALSHRGGTYTVPSLHGEHAYSVTYTAREESCSCRDWEFGHTCYHVLAAAVVRAKTGVCSGCCRRFRHRARAGRMCRGQPRQPDVLPRRPALRSVCR
jgi:hypothetical protein